MDWSLLKNNEFVVLDIETTGFSPLKGAKIIEIGAIRVKGGILVDTFETFINPDVKISKKITELTSITNEMVKDSPYIEQVLIDFKKFIGDTVIVAHNAPFDWDRFLVDGFKKVGITVTNKVIDTKELSKETFLDKKKHNLADMCSYLGITIEGHHRAINDANVTAIALLKLIEMNKEKIETAEVSIDLEPKTIVKKAENVVIKKVAHWKKVNTKGRVLYKRQYVTIADGKSYGTVFFDCLKNTWAVKEFDKDIDFDTLENQVLKFLKLNSKEELVNYEN